jgi:hypothetical protein
MSETHQSERAPSAGWSLLGDRPQPSKPLWVLLAISLIVGLETFGDPTGSYPLYLVALVVVSAGWLASKAVVKRSLFGLLAIPLGAVWLNPLLGGEWFSSQGAIFFLSHSGYALYVALASYTFMAREVKSP